MFHIHIKDIPTGRLSYPRRRLRIRRVRLPAKFRMALHNRVRNCHDVRNILGMNRQEDYIRGSRTRRK